MGGAGSTTPGRPGPRLEADPYLDMLRVTRIGVKLTWARPATVVIPVRAFVTSTTPPRGPERHSRRTKSRVEADSSAGRSDTKLWNLLAGSRAWSGVNVTF